MTFYLGKKSVQKLHQKLGTVEPIIVHPDLVAVVRLAIKLTKVDFTVLETLRTKERQSLLVSSGASWTMDSRHLTGHAVDLGAWVGGEISWHWRHYDFIGNAMKKAANEIDVPIEWGGDWKQKDGTHFQLPRKGIYKGKK